MTKVHRIWRIVSEKKPEMWTNDAGNYVHVFALPFPPQIGRGGYVDLVFKSADKSILRNEEMKEEGEEEREEEKEEGRNESST